MPQSITTSGVTKAYRYDGTITETKKEYYLSDANGHVIGLRSEVTPTGQTTQISWEYYAFGSEREARLTNLDSNPRFGPDEVSFYLNDHLGNTRVNYTPVATTIPPSDNEIFNDQFSQGQLLNWAGVSTTTVSVPSSSLVAQSPVGATQTVIHKAATFEATNTYTISVLPYFDNMTSIALECSGNTFTLIDNGLPNTFTFQGTNNSDGITITGLGAGTFSIKSINLTEHHPGGEVISYRINNAIDYFPYGKVLREYVGGEKERFLTTQHERDEETGLDYRGARYYDSDVARFLSLDPLARKFPAWSAYSYVFTNPIFFIDPTGRSPENAEAPRKDEHKKTGWTEAHLQLFEAFGDANRFTDVISEKVLLNRSNENELKNSTENNSGSNTTESTNSVPPPYEDPIFPGVVFVPMESMGYGSGMTLGRTIFLGSDGLSSKDLKDLKRHEYGHFLQFMSLGGDANLALYLTVIGVPSLYSAAGDGDHSKFWAETDANRRSYEFFGKPKDWNHKRFPIK